MKKLIEKHFDSTLWKTVIDTIQEGLMIVDTEGKILFVNKSFEELLGYKMVEITGKTCEIFKCDRCFTARAEGYDKYCSLFKEKKLRSSECIFYRKDGKAIHLFKNASVIRNEKGEVIAGVETLVDISKIVSSRQVIADLRKQLSYKEGFSGIIGHSRVMNDVFELATSAARSDAPLIIHGESGTGKELLAAAVHEISDRRNGPFIKVNCAALSDNLLESELFGHVKGAFTGAELNRIGRFEAAHGGSIFLDEIGDLPLNTQTKLLRVLQEKEIERVGDQKPISVDVRIITATHRNLTELIEHGQFREDLFYRINVIPVNLPPLRERFDDIPLLVENFMTRVRAKTGKDIEGMSSKAMQILVEWPWPGNIRELTNVIEYAFVLCPSGIINHQHLPPNMLEDKMPVGLAKQTSSGIIFSDKKDKLLAALQKTGGNKSEAAKLLGISRVTVWKWMKKFKI